MIAGKILTVPLMCLIYLFRGIRYVVYRVASLLLLVLLAPLIISAYLFNKESFRAPTAKPPAPKAPKLSVEDIEKIFPSRPFEDISMEEITMLYSGLPPPPRANASPSADAPAAPSTLESTAPPQTDNCENGNESTFRPNGLLGSAEQPDSGDFSNPISMQVSSASRTSASSGPTSHQTSGAPSVTYLHGKDISEPEYPALALARTMTADALACPICLCMPDADAMVRLLPCGHIFHCSCVDEWFMLQESSCPVCRREYCFQRSPTESLPASYLMQNS